MRINPSKFSKLLFIGFTSASAVIGTGAGALSNTIYKTKFSEGKKIEAHYIDQLSLEKFMNDQDINYSWIKNKDFNLTINVINDESSKKFDELVTFDYEKEIFDINGVFEGELKLTNKLDSSISYTTKISSEFYSADTKKVIVETLPTLFEDKALTKAEIEGITSLSFNGLDNFDGSDLKYFINLAKVNVNGGEKYTIIQNNSAPQSTHFYVPKNQFFMYEDYAWVKERRFDVFPEVSSPEYVSLLLYKNGGTILHGGSEKIEFVEVFKGSKYEDLPDEKRIFYPGNNFIGWKNKDGVLVDPDALTFSNDMQLFAEWEKKVYSVTYHFKDSATEPLTQQYYYKNDLEILGETAVPCATDETYIYKFLGWSLDPDSGSIDYLPNTYLSEFFDDSFDSVDLYAVWVYRYFKIEYYNKYGKMAEENCVYGQSTNLPSELDGDGEYVGLSKSEQAIEINYEPNTFVSFTYDFGNDDVVHFYILRSPLGNVIKLYRVSKPISVTIHYELLSGTPIDQVYRQHAKPATGEIKNGDSVQLLTNFDIAAERIEKVGYHFVGWQRSYSGKQYLFTQIKKTYTYFDEVIYLDTENVFKDGFDGKSNVVLTPYYETNLVSFNFKNKSRGSSSYSGNDITVTYDSDQKLNFSSAPYSSIDYHITSFKFLKGKPGEVTITPYAEVTKEIKQDAYLKVFNANYAETYQNRHTGLPNNVLNIDVNVEWAINSYTVTFNMQGHGSGYDAQVVNYGGKVKKPNGTPTDDKFEFVNWFKESSCINVWDFNSDVVTGPTTIYAGWKEKPTCLGRDTVVTLADYSTKLIQDVTMDDNLLAFNHFTGEFESASIIMFDHRELAYCWQIRCEFDNGQVMNLMDNHVLFDYSLMKYVEIDTNNASEFIGDEFYFLDGPSKLVDVSLTHDYFETFEFITNKTIDFVTDNSLSSAGQTAFLLNIAEFNDDLTYNEESLNENIEIYGLAPYEVFSSLVSYEMYESFNGQYINLALGYNNLDIEHLYFVIDLFFSSGGLL